MVQQDVTLPDGVKEGMILRRGGGRRRERFFAQFRRMIAFINGHEPGGRERAVNQI